MKQFTILAILSVLLVGCAKTKPITETIAENAINATTALEKTLADTCKTEPITTQIAVIKSEIRAMKSACDIEKDQITQEKLKWQWSFWALAVVVGVYLAKKVLK